MPSVEIVPFEGRFHEGCEELIAALPEWFGLPAYNVLRQLGAERVTAAVLFAPTGHLAGASTSPPPLWKRRSGLRAIDPEEPVRLGDPLELVASPVDERHARRRPGEHPNDV